MEEVEGKCHVCLKEVGGAHKCQVCNRSVHLICGKTIGEEGYGQKVTCSKCVGKEKDVGEATTSKKRKVMWDWKEARKQKENIPVKKQRLGKTATAAKKEKYVCLQCLQLSLKEKRDERFANLCRVDASSVKRHKERWHSKDEMKECTITPSTSKEVSALRERYRPKKEKRTESEHDTQIEIQIEEKDDESEMPEPVSDPETLPEPEPEPVPEAVPEEPQAAGTDEGRRVEKQTTLLAYQVGLDNPEDTAGTDLKHVMDAIAALNLKVDKIGRQHKSFIELAVEDSGNHETFPVLKRAENILEFMESSKLLEWFYDESTECAVLRCLPCFQLQVVANPNLANLTPFRAQQLLNRSGKGSMSTGIFVKKENTQLMIKGHNQFWYRQKSLCLNHLCLIGEGSATHQSAMKAYNKSIQVEEKKTATASNIFRAAIVDLKLGAAGTHFETLISLLASCSVNVGNTGHGRNNFNDILYCLEKTIDRRVAAWLDKPLPSTLLPPHFWATVDKATPSRTTNQAVIIVARDESGIPSPIAVDAPKVYTETHEASYETLAEQLVETITGHFSDAVVTRMCGIAADGPYQASGFSQQLRDRLKIQEDAELALPVTWDTAHVLNLAVTDVRDKRSKSGDYFRQFIKRCNVFNHILSNGKGFAFLEMVDDKARKPVSYAAQRFASSSYEQWVEWQYMIAGSDFVGDLLSFLDIMEPVVELMTRGQGLATPIWKLKQWWPKVRSRLSRAADGDPAAYPRLSKVSDHLKPGQTFKGVELMEGWLVLKDDGDDADDGRFTWQMREASECKEDRERFAADLLESLEKRIDAVANTDVIEQLEVFDAANLVTLQCRSGDAARIQLSIEEGEFEEYGVEQCKNLLKVISRMPHIESSGLNFDERMAHNYMSAIKYTVRNAVWGGLCPEWFISMDNQPDKNLNPTISLVEFLPQETDGLDSIFLMTFTDGSTRKVRLNEQRFYQSFYSNKEFYETVGPPSCAVLDVALAKGGPEAIAESFYNSMRNQQQSGGQSNDTLARRTKVNWCLPSVENCKGIIKEGVALYLAGDDTIRPHRKNTFFSTRAKDYNVSKVVDRVAAERGRCPFLID